jgi:hypothetical protein
MAAREKFPFCLRHHILNCPEGANVLPAQGTTFSTAPKGQTFSLPRHHILSRPEGANVLPAQGNALGKMGHKLLPRRPNGPTVRPKEKSGWPVGPMQIGRVLVPQGVTLGWENGWAFGPPHIAITEHKRHQNYPRSFLKNSYSAADAIF